jgi:hypothetical protein
LISTFLTTPLLIDGLGSFPQLADSRLNQPMK